MRLLSTAFRFLPFYLPIYLSTYLPIYLPKPTDLSSAATGSRAPTSNSRPEGSEEVLIGAASEGDERPCQRDMDVAKVRTTLGHI
jgi:hypothetical protein